MAGKTLFDKIWDAHVIADLGNGNALLHVDRHILHDMGGKRAFETIEARGLKIRNPGLTIATPDHTVSTLPGRSETDLENSAVLVPALRVHSRKRGIRLFDLGDPGQGIVHVVGPEQGFTLPGTLLCCGDSHTSTHGGLGAVAFGVGISEAIHILVTQSLVQKKPGNMRVEFEGDLPRGTTAKDMILHMIGEIGTAGGDGHAVEYAGSAIRALPVEGRLTICNMSIEFGAKVGMIAPDDATFAYVEGRPMAPKGKLWDQALAHWQSLPSDGDAAFDREVRIDAAAIQPQITWGTSPEHAIPVGAAIPDPADAPDESRREAWRAALAYMGLEPGRPIAGTRVDRVFIGSCTNSRLSDLRAAAEIAKGRRVAGHVTAWVVPGSQTVKAEAEAEGLDKIFTAAGFAWHAAGCSMCVGANGEIVAPEQRCVSTTNRNFVGRQGPRARTHLASPAMAAAAAIAGEITDVRHMMS
jgi:3-isopropylmalate/(R)-2-methylmalate dehydratase large subunit